MINNSFLTSFNHGKIEKYKNDLNLKLIIKK